MTIVKKVSNEEIEISEIRFFRTVTRYYTRVEGDLWYEKKFGEFQYDDLMEMTDKELMWGIK